MSATEILVALAIAIGALTSAVGAYISFFLDGATGGVIVTLHQVDYALRYCDRVVALKEGKVVYDGSAEGLKRDQLIDIYGPEFEDVFWEGAPT